MAELAYRIVLEGERPPRPMFSERLGFTDEVWGSLCRCWEKEPSARLSVDTVSACLEQAAETWIVDALAFMLANEDGVEQVMNLMEDEAKTVADRLDQVRSREPNHTFTLELRFYFILPFILDPRPNRHRSGPEEDILEVPPEAVRRIWRSTGLIYAHRWVR